MECSRHVGRLFPGFPLRLHRVEELGERLQEGGRQLRKVAADRSRVGAGHLVGPRGGAALWNGRHAGNQRRVGRAHGLVLGPQTLLLLSDERGGTSEPVGQRAQEPPPPSEAAGLEHLNHARRLKSVAPLTQRQDVGEPFQRPEEMEIGGPEAPRQPRGDAFAARIGVQRELRVLDSEVRAEVRGIPERGDQGHQACHPRGTRPRRRGHDHQRLVQQHHLPQRPQVLDDPLEGEENVQVCEKVAVPQQA
mmetsp:Transcript_5057/g.14183  ORF Transcript_5057/g.14183 Transcript_5057/m.14183 type:complete len:249 (+) Transcript_5057:654-1400(+)